MWVPTPRARPRSPPLLRAGDVEAAIRGGLRNRLYFEVVHVIDEVAMAITSEAGRISQPSRELATTLRVVLVPTDPEVRARLAFSVGDGATLSLAGPHGNRSGPDSATVPGCTIQRLRSCHCTRRNWQ